MKNIKLILSILAIVIFLGIISSIFVFTNNGSRDTTDEVGQEGASLLNNKENQNTSEHGEGFKDEAMDNDENSDDKIRVSVSILPQEFFVEQIGGDMVEVEAILPPGASPATYEPTPSDLANLENSELYFAIGHIPFEKNNIDRVKEANANLLLVDTSSGIELRQIEEHTHSEVDHHDEEEHSHDGEGAEDVETLERSDDNSHTHSGDDPHIWLDPNLVITQAEIITEALTNARPLEADYFENNKIKFIQDLRNLDSELAEIFEPFKGKTMLVYHPAFGYLADRYGFKQEAIEIEGKQPSLAEVNKIIEEAKADNINVIFVQKQFDQEIARSISQEIDGTVVAIDPLEKDYINNLKMVAENITATGI